VIDEDSNNAELNNAMSISYFLDYSGLSTIDGNPIISPLNINDYIEREKERISKEQHISEEDAAKIVEDDLKSKQAIVEISPFIHRLAISKYIGRGRTSNKEADKKAFIDWAVNEIRDLPESLKYKDGGSYPILE
jgi:hypothetical protein